MNRWNRAKGFREAWDAFSDNPAKLSVALAANSMSQMLPYGMKIIPSFMAAGAVSGATYGGVAGATAGGVGAIPGAIAGGSSGLDTELEQDLRLQTLGWSTPTLLWRLCKNARLRYNRCQLSSKGIAG